MKLIDICEFFSDFGGGVRTYVHQKLEVSAQEGWETTIIAPGPADRREKRLGGEVIWVRSPALALDPRYHMFRHAQPIHDLLDELQPDVVEGSSTWRGGWIAGKWQNATDKRTVKSLFLHQDPVAVYPQSLLSPRLSEKHVDQLCFWFWAYLRKLSRNFDVTAVSGDWFASRLESFGIQRPIVASFGIDKKLFSHTLRSEATRMEMLQACGVDDPAATLFIAVSRHHLEKRLSTVMKAFEKYNHTHPAGLYLVGDGPARTRIEREAQKVKGVHVAGHISDRNQLAKILASADYMVHGGAAETFGLVVAEALCSGLPLIVPDIGGAADLAHPTYAETYRAGDIDALTTAMNNMTTRPYAQTHIAARAGANRLSTPQDHFRSLLSQYTDIHEESERQVA